MPQRTNGPIPRYNTPENSCAVMVTNMDTNGDGNLKSSTTKGEVVPPVSSHLSAKNQTMWTPQTLAKTHSPQRGQSPSLFSENKHV
jgi:hypothetical protein